MFIKYFLILVNKFGKHYKNGLFVLFLMFIVSGFLELVGIAAIFPVMLLLTSPENPTSQLIFNTFSKVLPDLSYIQAAFILSLVMIFMFVIKDIYMMLCTYMQNKFSMNWAIYIKQMIVDKFFYSPYINIKNIPYGTKHTLLFSISKDISINYILKCTTLFANGVVALCIIVFLFYKFTIPAMTSVLFIGLFVYFENSYFKKKAKELGKKDIEYTSEFSNDVNFIIQSQKEIILSNKQEYFSNYIMEYSKKISENSSLQNAYGAYPVYVTEIGVLLAFLIMLASIIFLEKISSVNIVSSVAVISLIVLRLTPQINKILNSMYLINVTKPKVFWFLEEYEKIIKLEQKKYTALPKMEFKNEIKLSNVFFEYEKNKGLFDVNLTIKKGEFIGIIGSSGAGKTTLADLISGIYFPNSGSLFVDDIEITDKNANSWQKNISFLPQETVFLKGSVIKNVAWGQNEEEIDIDKVIKSLKMAAVYDEIEDINSTIKFSVGQKHRIALARVYYQDNDVLILDEATSSLDVNSENTVSENIAMLKGKKTIIAIAHRLQTLKKCDRIIYLNKGKIVDIGDFSTLRVKYPEIDRMLKISSFD